MHAQKRFPGLNGGGGLRLPRSRGLRLVENHLRATKTDADQIQRRLPEWNAGGMEMLLPLSGDLGANKTLAQTCLFKTGLLFFVCKMQATCPRARGSGIRTVHVREL